MNCPMYIDKTVVRSVTCCKCGRKDVLDMDSDEYKAYVLAVSKKTRDTYAKYFSRQGWRVDPENIHMRYCPDCGKEMGILKRRRKL